MHTVKEIAPLHSNQFQSHPWRLQQPSAPQRYGGHRVPDAPPWTCSNDGETPSGIAASASTKASTSRSRRTPYGLAEPEWPPPSTVTITRSDAPVGLQQLDENCLRLFQLSHRGIAVRTSARSTAPPLGFRCPRAACRSEDTVDDIGMLQTPAERIIRPDARLRHS